MSKLFGLNIRLYVDSFGKLRVNSDKGFSELYTVSGFKIKAGKERNYLFPILKIEIPKK